MKKLSIIIGFCVIGFAAQAREVNSKKKGLNKPACTITVTQTGTVDYYCAATDTWSHANVSGTGVATSSECSDAYNHANQLATVAVANATTAKINEFSKACVAP